MGRYSRDKSTIIICLGIVTHLALRIVIVCEREPLRSASPLYRTIVMLAPFNWDISDCEECAAVYPIDQNITIFHMASVRDNKSLVYQAKTLFSLPPSVL